MKWTCPVCDKPTGQQGVRLAAHGVPRCLGTGVPVVMLAPAPGEVPPPAWIPPAVPVDLAPFRRWRALGWTETQIAAVTGDGALW